MLNPMSLSKNAGVLTLVVLVIFQTGHAVEPEGKMIDKRSVETVTLLFTNDFESTYDPIPAFWRDDMEHIGGIAQMATLVDDLRESEANVFLFDERGSLI
jgi:2',3'-cyclic-nucleotide 2'-phosphodiesterase (5'-nucleotidase family)